MVSGLMNWKARSSEFLSGTRNVLPRMVISTSFSYGRKISSIRGVPASAIGFRSPAIEAKARGDGGQWKQGWKVFNAPMGNVMRSERRPAERRRFKNQRLPGPRKRDRAVLRQRQRAGGTPALRKAKAAASELLHLRISNYAKNWPMRRNFS